MKETPILFSDPMVRAIREGRKTQTRRVMRPQPTTGLRFGVPVKGDGQSVREVRCPYGQPGDRLWVREAWDFRSWETDKIRVVYRADGEQRDFSPPKDWHPMVYNYERWRPSIHMPRWASRIDLEVETVRVERLQDISEEDAKAEGAEAKRWDELRQFSLSLLGGVGAPIPKAPQFRYGYYELWNSINAKRGLGWDMNPWVWVLDLKPVEAPKC